MLETNATSLEALLAQVALGSRDAFDALYRSTANRLFGICLRVLAERAEAEDALQEVFTTVWRKAAQFDATKASATTWLRSIPTRQARASIELAEDLEDPGASPPQQAQAATDRAQLENCLERLEPRRRSLIRAAFFDGLTYEELATKIEAPLGTIKSWIRRGLMQLRECLGP
jgi:RNA polymerase sigma-70 factor (ECF subfamily)